MAAISILSDFRAQKEESCHCFHLFPFYLPWSDRTRCHDLSFFFFQCWVLSWLSQTLSSFLLRVFSLLFIKFRMIYASWQIQIFIYTTAVLFSPLWGINIGTIVVYLVCDKIQHSCMRFEKKKKNGVELLNWFDCRKVDAKICSRKICNWKKILNGNMSDM